MAIFVTGTTGYIGSYVATGLLEGHRERLALLVRAKTVEDAEERLWKSLQLHMGFDKFLEYLRSRIDIYLGDITLPDLGLEAAAKTKLIKSMTSVIHCAASLNRKSDKACFNVNLRGTLAIIQLARAAHEQHGLRRMSDVSTVAVAGKRQDEVVTEDLTIDWERSDYDPYARTKKFCEHMLHELLPDVPITVFRPSIVLGDSRFPETTQFDMVRAFGFLSQLPILPFRRDWRIDIVPADYVGRAIVEIHQKEKPAHDAYNLSSGTASLTYGAAVEAIARAGQVRPNFFLPWLQWPFTKVVNLLADTPRELGIAGAASLMKVFLPYLVFNTVFDNTRVCEELGEAPKSFDQYAYGLLRFAIDGGYEYPYKPWPAAAVRIASKQR
ncbi:MAG: SDR family oxidoreductase [Planctomycetes bacterium]|nr:SDR family oxidoreductase [Planctomycetota bacterium]